VVAGHPVVAEQFIEEEIPVPAFLATTERSFLLRVRGDSMEGAGILDDDLVVVRQSNQPKPGDIVVVTLDGETTLKRFVRDGGSWLLAPENPKYKPIRIRTTDLAIHGVVTGLIRSLHSRPRRVS
jgi:SOS regulatory protein LexA